MTLTLPPTFLEPTCFVAVLLLLVWVLYGKKRSIGIALWTLYAVAVGIALAIKYLQPKVGATVLYRPPG
jgi:hypothetical protein